MKRVLFILLALGLAVALAMLWRGAPGSSWQPGTRGTFIGFTDVTGMAPGTNALFTFSSIPRENTTWKVWEISQFDGTNWQSWNPLPSPAFFWAMAARTNREIAGVVPLPTTSAPVRIVIQLRCEVGVVATVRQFLRRWFPGLIFNTKSNKTYYMTNNVVPAP